MFISPGMVSLPCGKASARVARKSRFIVRRLKSSCAERCSESVRLTQFAAAGETECAGQIGRKARYLHLLQVTIRARTNHQRTERIRLLKGIGQRTGQQQHILPCRS